MENEDSKRLFKREKHTGDNSNTLGLDEWDTVEYPIEKLHGTDQKRVASFEFVTLQEFGQVHVEPKREISTQISQVDMMSDMKSDLSQFLKLYESLSVDVKNMRDEIKTLSELAVTMRKEMKDEIKDIKTLGEREKNRYVRSNIPFRFVPEHTIGCHQFGI